MKIFGLIIFILTIVFVSCKRNDLESLKEARVEFIKEGKEIKADYEVLLKENSEGIRILDSAINAHPKNVLAVKEIKKVPVTVIDVEKRTFEHFFEVHGNVEATENAAIYSQVPGRISQIHVYEGQSVQKGELLVTLDAAQLKSGIKELEKGLELANKIFVKQKSLWDQKIGSEVQFLEIKNNKESLEQRLLTMNEQLNNYKIRAPFQGVVDDIIPKVGESATPASPIVRVLNLNKVYLEGSVSEQYISSVKAGGFVEVKFPSLGESIKAKVSRVGNFINPANRTFQVKVEFNNSKRKYKPNQLAVMKIRDYKANNAFVIPARIVQQDRSGQDYVYTFEGDEIKRVKKLEINLGVFYDGFTEVLSGLDSNFSLIDKGSKSVQAADAIEIK
jgi:RND family efflux transporter MFP subunit